MTGGSGRDSRKRRGGGRRLSEEDQSLWQRIASSVDPLPQAKPRVPDVDAGPMDGEPDPPTHPSPPLVPKGTKPVRTTTAGGLEKPARVSLSKPGALPPSSSEGPRPLPVVHRRQARRIASGVIEIEDRLDLHGATQSVAHARLVAFVKGSAARGLRTVLVITGKGGSRERNSPSWERGDAEVGILRRSVPRWLAEAPLRGLVISYQAAAHRHGGDGAFYILLRRSRRPAG